MLNIDLNTNPSLFSYYIEVVISNHECEQWKITFFFM